MRRVLLLVLFALIVVSSACSDGDGSGSGGGGAAALQTVRAASARTLEADTSRLALEVGPDPSEPSVGESPSGKLKGEGLFDYRAKAGRLVFDVGATGVSSELGDRAETVLRDDVVYLRFGEAAGLLPDGKPWLKVDLQALARREGFALGSLDQLQANDPSRALAYLRGVSGNVREMGREEVRGVPTTRYSGIIDIRQAAEKAPADVRPQLVREAARLGLDRVPTEVWIDDEGRVRRMTYRVDPDKAKTATAEFSGKVKITMELYDFGVPVDVQAPPADQVTDVFELHEATEP